MSKPQFKQGDKLVCFHQGHDYEARCIGMKEVDGEWWYKIHYHGWKTKWDEWIPSKSDRIQEYSEKNLKMKSTLKEPKSKQKRPKKGKGKPADPAPDTSRVEQLDDTAEEVDMESTSLSATQEVPSTQSSAQSETTDVDSVQETQIEQTEKEKAPLKYNQFRVPTILEDWLREDHYQIHQLKRLPIIPAPHSVHDILEEYRKFKTKTAPPSEHAHVHKLVITIEELFNTSCGSRLIYNYEHAHYREKHNEYENTSLSLIYGCPHLLRLFYIIKNILDQKKLPNINAAVTDIEDIVDFVCSRDTFFKVGELYGMASADYARLA